MSSPSRPVDGYVLVVAADGRSMRIRHLAKTMAALLLGFAGLFGLTAVALLANPVHPGTIDPGGVFCIVCGALFALAWVWGHFLPATVFLGDHSLISRGKLGRKHRAVADQIEGIGIRLRTVFNGRYSWDFYCPYVKLPDGRGFWL